MTISDSFWSFARLAESWSSTPSPPKPRRRTAVYTQQHIETIGGGNENAVRFSPFGDVLGNPRLPVELIVHIVLLAAQDISLEEPDAASAQLLELARVSRACHRAIYSTFLLPDVCLYGLQQLRSFAVALDKDRLGIRTLARTRMHSLTVRARGHSSLQHGYGPALFDASQAQTHFEKDLLPFIRIVLSHCHELQTLHLEGVPRGLQRHLARLSVKLGEYSCLVGHYGADLDRDFWLANRWTNLEHLQLHGPRFRFAPSTATTLAGLPRLKKLGLIVPMIVSSTASPAMAADTGFDAVELDMSGNINPLQILIDRCSTLQVLLLVGHAEKDYVGYTEKYRRWLRSLRRRRLADADTATIRLQLVTSLRRCSVADDEDSVAPRRRVHPCEVSAWMMGRCRRGLHWFESGEQDSQQGAELDHWIESFELADHPSNASSTATTATSSALMSRTGSNSIAAAGARTWQPQNSTRATDDAIQAVDMLPEDDDDDD